MIQKQLLEEFISEVNLETLDLIRSAGVSTRIKKGNEAEKVVRNLLKEHNFEITKGRTIPLLGGTEDDQNSYDLDNFLKLDNEILLIDHKGEGWNGNVPLIDQIKKYIRAKKAIEGLTDKKVRFILLKNGVKPTTTSPKDKRAAELGIETIYANEWLTGLLGKPIVLDDLLKDFCFEKFIDKINELKERNG